MKKLIIILLILVILFGIFIWPLDICNWHLLKTFKPEAQEWLENKTGLTSEDARNAVGGAAQSISNQLNNNQN